MLLAQGLTHFSARLQSLSGETIACGFASVDTAARSVTFESDFVPLYSLGTPLTLMRLHDGRDVHRFTGAVYLSSKKLLRLTGVHDALLPGSEEVYCGGLPFTGRIVYTPPSFKKSFLFGQKHKEEAPLTLSVSLPELTCRQVVFLYRGQDILDPGQRFVLLGDPPLSFAPVTLTLNSALFFGAQQPCLCSFVDLREADRAVLAELLSRYNLRHHKLF